MSSTETPPINPTPPAPTFVSPGPGARRSGGRRAAIIVGALVASFGAVLAIAGGALFAVFGSDGIASTGRHDLSTPTSALVSETASIDDTAEATAGLGAARIKVDARADGGRPVFVGVAPAGDVERYLAGAASDEVTDVDVTPFRIERNRRAGTETPAPPAAQSFWVAQSNGPRAAVNWKIRDGDYRVVVMNADGSRGVATRSKFGIDLPFMPGVAIGLFGVGFIMAAGGVAAIVVGARRPR
jgi:hypothetical protein